MDLNEFYSINDKEPLDRMAVNGGYCGIFRTIGCIGDSLSSGEFESLDEKGQKRYHDYYEYSWGQYIARTIQGKVYNFSKGGMTAKEYMESFAEQNDFWDVNKVCQAYIIALGENDITANGENLGNITDINMTDYRQNKETFLGYYAAIIQRLKNLQPKAKFFLLTIPQSDNKQRENAEIKHCNLMYELAETFENTYVIDLRKYAVTYDSNFKKNFFLGGHMNAAGYILTARMIMSYIDYIVRKNMEDFTQVPFIGKQYHNVSAKW